MRLSSLGPAAGAQLVGVQGATLFGENKSAHRAYGASIVDHATDFIRGNDDVVAANDQGAQPRFVSGSAASRAVHTKTPVSKLPVYDASGAPLRMRETPRIAYSSEHHLVHIDEHCSCDLQEPEYTKRQAALTQQYPDPDDYRFGHVHTFQITCPTCGWGARIEQNNKQYAIPLHGLRSWDLTEHCEGVYEIVTSKMAAVYDLQRHHVEAPYVPPVPVVWQAYNEWTGKYLLEDGTEDPDADKAFKFTDRTQLGVIIAAKTAQLAAKNALASKDWLHVWGYTEKGQMLPDLDPNSPTYAADQLLIELLGFHPGQSYYNYVLMNPSAYRWFAVVDKGIVVGVYTEQSFAAILPTNAETVRIKLHSQVQPGWVFTGSKFRSKE